jgi:alkylated DNA repair dioxygenase AlkB
MTALTPYRMVHGRRVWRPTGRPADTPAIALQASLFADAEEPTHGPLGATVQRRALSHGAWVDVRRGWVAGADLLFERLRDNATWQTERRQMYDRVVDVPRLSCYLRGDVPWPDPMLYDLKAALDAHYEPELREPFVSCGMAYYRDGRDSVAWHGDTIGRASTEDTIIAIVSVGAPRAFLLRPRGGGPSLKFEVGHGDLLVMGGSAQRTWEHAVPKTAKDIGPRISIQYRCRDVA